MRNNLLYLDVGYIKDMCKLIVKGLYLFMTFIIAVDISSLIIDM